MMDIRAAVLILSDKGYSGEREDKCGPLLAELLQPIAEVAGVWVLPDDREEIANKLKSLADSDSIDLVFTSGGTGLSPRDVTPEATGDIIERVVPGIPEAMRRLSMEKTDMAMLSRATAGIRGRTLIINLPGSPKAVRECMEFIWPVLGHAVETLRGEAYECGTVK